MKLEVIVKFIFIKSFNKFILCFTFLSVVLCLESNAQKYKLSLDSVPLSDALLKASEQFDFKVAFDAQKVSSVIISKEASGNSEEEFVKDLLLNSGFDFQYKHGRFLIIKKETEPGEIKECQLTGLISDKETGEQLPFASVVLLNQNLYTSSSSNGSFCVKSIQANPIHLTVNYIGYYLLDTLINWKKNVLDCDFRLSRKFQMIDSIVVKEAKIEMVDLRNDVDFATTINASKLIDLPELAETDIFKTLQLLPGISYSENSAELSIRGGSSDQNLVLFDGQTLYNLSHYFGVISSINPNIVKDIQVYKGGYDSRYGERVSGIVDITGKSGNQKKATLYGDLNLISGNLATEIPVGKKITLIAACRRSYSDIYATGFANRLFKNNTAAPKDSANIVNETTPSFYFYDYNAKLTYKLSNKENFTLSLYGGKDYFKNNYGGNNYSFGFSTLEDESWHNYGVSAAWMKQWNSSLYSNIQLGTSGYSNEYTDSTALKPRPPNQDPIHLPEATNIFEEHHQNDLKDFSAAMRNIYNFNNNNQLNFGIIARNNNIYYYKDANGNVYDKFHQSALVSSIYFQDRIILFKNLTIKPGFRLNYYDGNKKFYFEPRFAANYRVSDKFSVRLAAGRYCQYISQVLDLQKLGYNNSFWVLSDNSGHPVLTSNHFIFGSTLEFGNFLFDAEAYYKYFSGLQEYISKSLFQKNNQEQLSSYFTSGIGKSYGIDFFLKYEIRKLTSWLSYSLSKCVQQIATINNNKEIPAPNDQTHQLSWTNMLTVGKWNFSTITLFSTGRPYYNNMNVPKVSYYERLPNYFRNDLSVNYNFTIGKIRLKTGATIINLFNRHNYFDIKTRQFDFVNSSFSQTTLIRSQELSLNLFVHFAL
jgi:ferric enterobactin receptor